METKIILIRHGESLANAKRIYLGHTDWDLSERGYREAAATAEYLKDVDADAVYSSDLIRAYHTALPNAEMRSLKVITSKELREIYLGDWEGRLISQLEEIWADEFIHGWRENFGIFCPPNGEAVPCVANRIYNEVLRIARLHPDKTVIIASHAAAIRAFWGKVTATAPELVAKEIPFPKNASCTTVIYDGEQILPVRYGYADFLSEI